VIRVSFDRSSPGLGWQVFARKGFLSNTQRAKQVASDSTARCNRSCRGAHNHQTPCARLCRRPRRWGSRPKIIEAASPFTFGGPAASPARPWAKRVVFALFTHSKATKCAAAVTLRWRQSFQNIRWICGGWRKMGLGSLFNPLGHSSQSLCHRREAAPIRH